MIASEQEIIDSDIIYSNIALETLWNSTATYNVGDEVRWGNRIYKSTSSLNKGKEPNTVEGGKSWLDWEPSNALALIDLYEDTITEWTGDGIFEFKRGLKNNIAIGNFMATNIKIEYKDSLGDVILTQNFPVPRRTVRNRYDYIYAPFNLGANTDVIYKPIEKIGYSIRVTLENNGGSTSCGYLVAGRYKYLGKTLVDVSFPDQRVGSETINVADFTTIVNQSELMDIVATGKKLSKIPMLFVIDESTDSVYNNIVMIGNIMTCEGAVDEFDKHQIRWNIQQNKEL